MKTALGMAALLLLASCSHTAESITFDVWYNQVINEPYDPLNGSKY